MSRRAVHCLWHVFEDEVEEDFVLLFSEMQVSMGKRSEVLPRRTLSPFE